LKKILIGIIVLALIIMGSTMVFGNKGDEKAITQSDVEKQQESVEIINDAISKIMTGSDNKPEVIITGFEHRYQEFITFQTLLDNTNENAEELANEFITEIKTVLTETLPDFHSYEIYVENKNGEIIN
jgi:uncharacterized protein YxeA